MEDNKMKTIAHDSQREIITALLVLLISFTVLTAVKAQGDQDSYEGIINESVLHNKISNIAEDKMVSEISAAESYLTEKIKSWISEGSYWDRDTYEGTHETEFAYKIKEWMLDGSFWSSVSGPGKNDDDITLYEKEKIFRDLMAEDGN